MNLFQLRSPVLVSARSVDAEKGADKGIDGRLYFHDEGPKGKTKQIVISVKSGHVQVSHIRDLRGVIEREEAEIGVFITLNEPTKPMRTEAADAGFYTAPCISATKHPRIQILTIEELLSGKRIDYPVTGAGNVTFKKAPKAQRGNPEGTETGEFDWGGVNH